MDCDPLPHDQCRSNKNSGDMQKCTYSSSFRKRDVFPVVAFCPGAMVVPVHRLCEGMFVCECEVVRLKHHGCQYSSFHGQYVAHFSANVHASTIKIVIIVVDLPE